MQHLGEVSAAQRSRGKGKRDKWQVKPRKEIQKRSFWRRFFSSFLSLLKEKRPSETKWRRIATPVCGLARNDIIECILPQKNGIDNPL